MGYELRFRASVVSLLPGWAGLFYVHDYIVGTGASPGLPTIVLGCNDLIDVSL